MLCVYYQEFEGSPSQKQMKILREAEESIALTASTLDGDALEVLKNIKGIAKVEFDIKDIVRHKLVQRIVEAYDKRSPLNPPKVDLKKKVER